MPVTRAAARKMLIDPYEALGGDLLVHIFR